MKLDFERIWQLATPTFDRTPTVPILIFEVLVIAAVASFFFVFGRHTPRLWMKFLVMAGGVLVFEVFTAPMWTNHKMGAWAYVYRDVSWILTIGWSALILTVVLAVDRWLSAWSEARKFGVYLAILVVCVVIAETIVVKLGIRGYAPEILERVHLIAALGIPWEMAYYVPVFCGLVIAFYKYWNLLIDETPLVRERRQKWWRGVGLTALAVVMFELMVDPLVDNRGLPAWSYVWHDLSLILTVVWVLIIAVAAIVVERFLFQQSLPVKFAAAMAIMYVLAVPLESLCIRLGYRVYGESAVSNFIGINTPLTGVPIEIAFAVPCYLMLIVCFVRYWEIILDNQL